MASSRLIPILFISFIYLFLPLHASSITVNPFTAAANTVRYWNRKIPNKAPQSDFFLSLLSPLPASLSSSLPSPLSISPSLCRSARLLCPLITSTMSANNPASDSFIKYIPPSSSPSSKRGIIFREGELREGNVMQMPDITDKMPARSFLPQSIAGRIPFEVEVVKSLFGMEPNTTLAKAVDKTVAGCQMSLSQGEMNRCTTSAEDMIDFAVEMLGDDIVLLSTESSNGSSGPIMIGKVKGINGGKLTRSVSCHQRLFPYMVYHCHSVAKVRVYEVEIMSIETKKRINKGFAICHLDPSAWRPGNLALLLSGKPRQRDQVCHWISNGDLIWVVADHDPNQYTRSY